MVSNYVSEDDRCFICGNDQLHLLDSHHIVPDRYGGSDDQFNRVTLCKNCHGAVERIYTDSVFNRLGVPKTSKEPEEHGEMTMERFKTLDTPEQFEYLHRNGPQPRLRRTLEHFYETHHHDEDGQEESNVTVEINLPASERKRNRGVKDILKDLSDGPGNGVVQRAEVIQAIEDSKMDTLEAKETLQELVDKGEVCRIDKKTLQLV